MKINNKSCIVPIYMNHYITFYEFVHKILSYFHFDPRKSVCILPSLYVDLFQYVVIIYDISS